MYTDGRLLIAKSGRELCLSPAMANRHGLIAGATGTGKTVTMRVMAEGFSEMGVPVFLADAKGDLSGLCSAGVPSADMAERIGRLCPAGFAFKGFPTCFWDIFGEQGHPVRVTVSDMGPVLLARLLGLTEVQTGVLNIVFRVADDQGLLLLDLKDLRSMLSFVSANRAEFSAQYGNVSAASVGAIQRALLGFEDEGGALLFGEPALDIADMMGVGFDGRGRINILNARRLIQSPTVYATFLLWLMTELFERLPEVGDLEKPRMIFFFDEAHLLFDGAPKTLTQKIVQVVKLIRSKGVGIYFVTQNPSDIPGEVLAQLSNRVQHALRAYTPAEQKTIRAAAGAFRANSAFSTAEAITQLGVGEALISFLDAEGIPEIVERAYVLPPQSLMGAGDPAAVSRCINTDGLEYKYRAGIDRESAYEILERANAELERQKESEKLELQRLKAEEKERARQEKEEAAARVKAEKAAAKEAEKRRKTIERAATNAASSVARTVSSNLVNSVMGGKQVSTQTMMKRAATNALSSVMRSGTNSIVRGMFGNKR